MYNYQIYFKLKEANIINSKKLNRVKALAAIILKHFQH